MVDYVAGLIALLRASEPLQLLVEDRIYGMELPRDTTSSEMPRTALVVNPSGGLGIPSYAPITRPRIDLRAYGSSPNAAMKALLAAHDVLKYAKNDSTTGVKFYGLTLLSHPVNLREPDTEWPLAVSSWEMLVNEIAA